MRFSIAVTALLANTQVLANTGVPELVDAVEELGEGLIDVADAFYEDPSGFLTGIQTEIMNAVREDIDMKEAQMEEGQEMLENWWEDVTWRANEISVPTNMTVQDAPVFNDNECWSKVQRVVDVINEFGTDPSKYMTEGREMDIARRREQADQLDAALTQWKQQVLDELEQREMNLQECEGYDCVQNVLDKIHDQGGLNLKSRRNGNKLNLQECANNWDVVDSAGDGCDWYESNPGYCGVYDTADFIAKEACCSCKPRTDCENNAQGNTDSTGDDCTWYDMNPGSCGYYDTETFRANDMCCACNGGTVLKDPQWRIDLDYAQADVYGQALDQEYQDLGRRMSKVMEDWQTDRTVIDNYYWNRKFMPLLEEGADLDEKTLRTIVTWIADGTQVKGKPIAEVFPEIKEFMLDNYNPEGETIVEVFGMDRMPMVLQDEEWEGADWFTYYDCVKEFGSQCHDLSCLDDVASTTCWGYDTWNQDFYTCFNSNGDDCEGLGVWIGNQYLNTRPNYSYEIPHDDNEWTIYVVEYDLEHYMNLAHDDSAPAAPKNITFSFFFDEAEVRQFLEKEETVYNALGRQYEDTWNNYVNELMPLMQQIDTINQKYDGQFKDLDRDAEVQVRSTMTDIGEWWERNYSYTEEPQYVQLSHKVQKQAPNTDYMWYAGIAGTTLALTLCASMYFSKKEEKAAKFDQVAEALVSQE